MPKLNQPEKPTSESNTSPKATEKAASVERIDYPGLMDGDKIVLLTEWPEDWSPKTHKGLKRSNFKCESIWYLHQAAKYRAKVVEMENKAEEAKVLGNSADAAKAKKMLDSLRKANEIREQLLASGFDMDAFEKLTNKDLDGDGKVAGESQTPATTDAQTPATTA